MVRNLRSVVSEERVEDVETFKVNLLILFSGLFFDMKIRHRTCLAKTTLPKVAVKIAKE